MRVNPMTRPDCFQMPFLGGSRGAVLLSLLAGIWFGLVSPGYASEAAGEIVRLSGDVAVVSADGAAKPAAVKMPVAVGDTVTSQASSQALIRLKDKSTLLVRPSSAVQIKAFVYSGGEADRLEAGLVSGALRAVSGQIAKSKPNAVKYSVGTATIGIRGTDFELAVIPDGQKDRAGLYNYVYDGQTEMALASGEKADIDKELTGFAPANLKDGEARLQVLRDRPAFLQSTGFDTLMQQLTQPRIPMIR